jgi:DtxR family Mn-dependent transcriptional regulator
MSEKVERRVLDLFGHPTLSPYGNPIPGLEELGVPAAEDFLAGVTNLIDALSVTGSESSGVLRRLGEPVQIDPQLLRDFATHGLIPGAQIAFQREGARVRVSATGFTESLDLPLDIAVHIFVNHSQ